MAYEAFGDEGPRPRNDAYTGLLAISFFAMLIASLLLLVDWYGYEGMDNPAKRVKNSLPPVKPVAGLPVGGGEAAKPAPAKAEPKPKVEEKPAMPDKGGDAKPKMEDKGKEKMDAKPKMDAKDKDGKDKMEKKDEK